jgi:hypothetical protein
VFSESRCLSVFQIWYDNVPHPKLVEYEKDQNWVRKSGNYLVFPGGGTQFKEGVTSYIEFIEKVYHFFGGFTSLRILPAKAECVKSIN